MHVSLVTADVHPGVALTGSVYNETGCLTVISALTFADASLFIEVVPWWTLTLETAKCVDTVSTLAEAWKLLALVNIWKRICFVTSISDTNVLSVNTGQKTTFYPPG